MKKINSHRIKHKVSSVTAPISYSQSQKACFSQVPQNILLAQISGQHFLPGQREAEDILAKDCTCLTFKHQTSSSCFVAPGRPSASRWKTGLKATGHTYLLISKCFCKGHHYALLGFIPTRHACSLFLPSFCRYTQI